MNRAIALILLSSAALWAQALKITGGAADEQVFQRSPGGLADIPLSGAAPSRVAIDVRLERKGVLVRDWAPLARSEAGRWEGTVSAVPAGGPYRLTVRAGNDTAAVDNILVGDLWVLSGQSNMEGVGNLVDTTMPHELVHSFDLLDNWVVAEDPLHNLIGAVDPVHQEVFRKTERLTGEKLRDYNANRKKGAGLGLPFGVEMLRKTGVPVGLVPCAHGGTSMDQWSPALKEQGGHSLYGAMLRRIQAVGGRVTGVLWYQGESDASPKAAPEFQKKFADFVARLREDTGAPSLPFYYVQIGRFVNQGGETEWNQVQQAQLNDEAIIPHSGMISAIDVELDDGIHVSTQDHKRLGHRLADLACHDLFPGNAGCVHLKRGPRPVSATFRNGVVRVVFSEVNGTLQAPGRISGFSIHAAQGGPPLPLIYKERVDPDDPGAILLFIGGKMPEGATLHYGYGKDPYCNLRDSEDMGVPVFGPMPIQQ